VGSVIPGSRALARGASTDDRIRVCPHPSRLAEDGEHLRMTTSDYNCNL
jgi:hypothetical protein